MMMMMVSPSTAGMNMNKVNAKGMSRQVMQQQQQAPSDQNQNGNGVRPERLKMPVQFSKTEMCKFNLLGSCNKGSACGFAHSEVELKSRPDLSRTRLCRAFLQSGTCPDGKNCTFAHSKDELRTTDFFHKTKLCKFWQAGHCILDTKCRFAHSTKELKDDATKTQNPQQQNQQQNQQDSNGMAIPAMINQIQLLLQQQAKLQQQLEDPQVQQQMRWQQQDQQDQQYQSRKEIYRGCATPEYGDFDTSQVQAPQGIPVYPAALQHKIGQVSGANTKMRWSEYPQDTDGFNSWSTSSNLPSPHQIGSDSETETTCWECSGADSYDSNTPDIPPQGSVRMVPPMQQLPVLLAPVQHISTVQNCTGDAIEHYAGDLEIVQTPLFDETSGTPTNDVFDWEWESDSEYQVKNTFISVKDASICKPLRSVQSAAGRLTDLKNLS